MRGDDVALLQTVLAKLGFDCGRADGIFGTNTLRALTDFQQNYGLIVDGICGVHTIRALERTSSQSGLALASSRFVSMKRCLLLLNTATVLAY